MALPVRVSREPSLEPFELMRRDWPDFFFDRFFGPSPIPGNAWRELSQAATLGVDIREDANHIYVDADLPGFNKDEVDVSLEGGTLTITAEKRQEPTPTTEKERKEKGQYLLRERRYERYQRSFTLPQNVDDQNVNAKLENGCLTIALNKTEQSKARKIPLA